MDGKVSTDIKWLGPNFWLQLDGSNMNLFGRQCGNDWRTAPRLYVWNSCRDAIGSRVEFISHGSRTSVHIHFIIYILSIILSFYRLLSYCLVVL